MASWLVLALGILAAVWLWPAVNRPRRFLGMFADAGAITFGLSLAGRSGNVMVASYLFTIFAHGFRYGRAYLLLKSATVAVAADALAAAATSLLTMVLPMGASAMPASFRC
jgi:hypothetical protein